MPNYSGFKYGDRQYGEAGRVITRSYLFAQVTDFGVVRLQIEMPSNVGSEYALLRSTSGTAEDPTAGHVVATGTAVAPIFTVTDDGSSGVVVSPGIAYYTLFLFDSYGQWSKDAATSVMVPADRNTLATMMRILPSMYTSDSQNPIDPVVMDSELGRFLYGFALTYDEMAVYIDSILPENRSKGVIRRLHDSYANGVGMPTEYTIGSASSARLYRESGYIYRNKGTLSGIATYVEALTGWSTTVTEGSNMLTGTTWTPVGATLAPEAVAGPVWSYETVDSPFVNNTVELATLTATTATLTLPGDLSPTKATPVVAGTTYYLKVPVQAKTGTPSVQPKITWLDTTGATISTTSLTNSASTGSWVVRSHSAVAPAKAKFAVLVLALSGSVSNAVRFSMPSFSKTDGPYRDPRSVTIICHPSRVNLVVDPAMSDPTTRWTLISGTAFTASTDHPLLGLRSGKVTGATWDVRSNIVPVSVGYEYTLTASAWRKDASTATMSIEWRNSGGTAISRTVHTFAGSTSAWVDMSATEVAPVGAVTARIWFTGTNTVYLGGVIFERSDSSQAFFTGAQADVYSQDGLWSNATTNSYSLLYPGRTTKMARLRQTIGYYLPVGVTARILLWNSQDPEVTALVPLGA